MSVNSDDNNDVYNTAFSSLFSDLFDYGLAIEANSTARVRLDMRYTKIVNNLICKGYGTEGMKGPF
jgi:hypothetical protein